MSFKLKITGTANVTYVFKEEEPTLSLEPECVSRLIVTARHFVCVLALRPDLFYHDVVGTSSAWLDFTFLVCAPVEPRDVHKDEHWSLWPKRTKLLSFHMMLLLTITTSK